MRTIFYSGHSAGAFSRVLIIILIIASTILFKVPSLGAPFDRDSGLFAFLGYMHNQGHIIYKDLASSRPPGIIFLFALLFNFFKPTDITVNIFLLYWAILNVFLVYLLSLVLFNDFLGSCLAVVLYGFFSNSPFVNGDGAMTEHFMVTFNMLGFYFLIKAEKCKKIWPFLMSGLFFGVAFLFKQVGIFDYFAAMIYLLILVFLKYDKVTSFLKKVTAASLAFVLPFSISILYYNYKGALKEFIFWVFEFNFKYIKLLGYNTGNYWQKFIYFNANIFKTTSILWIGSIIFIFLLVRNLFRGRITQNDFFKVYSNKFILMLWGVFSFIGVCSSSRFFPHYYIAILPSFVLMSMFALKQLWIVSSNRYTRALIFIFVAFSIGQSLYFNYNYFFKFSPEEISKHEYGWEPFVEARQAGLYIRDNTKPADYIYVWAEEQEIYFYCLRKPPCLFLDNDAFTYFNPIFRNAEDILVSFLEKKQPVYFVIDTRHLNALASYKKIEDFVQKNYALEKEFKVVRGNVWGYSLLVCRLKQ